MSGTISEDLQSLDDFLSSDALGAGAMLSSERDGFFAGLVVCPALIMPREWLPLVWGEQEPVFDSEAEAQGVVDRIFGHYSDVIKQLDRGKYRPVYDTDSDDSILWESWIEGFWRAVMLRPFDWRAHGETDDKELLRAVVCLTRLHELATRPAAEVKPMELDEDLKAGAPEFIPEAVEILHRARLARARSAGGPKVGRNDPCPCGSGKKYKKCCLQ
jgi:uncharacterized protein